jgi:hypothetical protein
MGTSNAYGGSAGAWGGRPPNEFNENPDDETADKLVGHALEALSGESDGNDQADGLAQTVADAALANPGATAIPGLRISSRRGGGGTGGGGRTGVGGGGRGRTSGTRSTAGASRAGSRAIAAAYALRDRDAAGLQALGLTLAELDGLSVFDQMKRILDVTCPATGSPQEEEIRAASRTALIELLGQDGTLEPAAVVRVFVAAYVFEAMITEYGDRIRMAESNGARAMRKEDILKASIRAYADRVELEDIDLTADGFRAAIETVLAKAERLVAG